MEYHFNDLKIEVVFCWPLDAAATLWLSYSQLGFNKNYVFVKIDEIKRMISKFSRSHTDHFYDSKISK